MHEGLLNDKSCSDPSSLRKRSIAMVMEALTSLSVPPQNLSEIYASLVSDRHMFLTEDLGLDSLGSMEFCIHLELEFGCVVSPDDLLKASSAANLLSFIEIKMCH